MCGCSAVIAFLSLLTAVYWGQLSKCETVSSSVAQYSCSQRIAYAFVCVFASILFVMQTVWTVCLVKWRGELINEIGLYDDIGGTSNAFPGIPGSPYEPVGGSNPIRTSTNAVDL